jgi:soluble cytochrome b562
MSILDNARAGQNALEQLMNAIPGFKGYREKELRRDADKLQREHVAGQLDACKGALNDAANAATRGGSLDAINDVETARKRLDKVAARIRWADRGYAGFFDTIKVDEKALERVYQFDLGLVVGVDAIAQAAAELPKAADVPAGLKRLIAQIDALDQSLAQREQILAGIQ